MRLLYRMSSYGEMATTLRILAFGPVRAQLGADRLDIVCEDSVSQDELWSLLLELHPGLKPFRATIRLAREGEFLPPDARLQPGEEIALIPPVSGG